MLRMLMTVVVIGCSGDEGVSQKELETALSDYVTVSWLEASMADQAPYVTPSELEMATRHLASKAALAMHAEDDALHAEQVAAEAITGVIDVDHLPSEVVLDKDLPPSGASGKQVIAPDDVVLVTSAIPVRVLELDVHPVRDTDVVFAAHVFLEKEAEEPGRYEVSVRRDQCGGPVVGRTYWMSGWGDGTPQGATLSFTASDTSVQPGTAYALCVDKLDGDDPDVIVRMRGAMVSW